MSQDLSHLLESITSKTLGIFWLTDTPLSLDCLKVNEFNYLLNGTLYRQIKNPPSGHNPVSFFLTQNFGHDFFLAHIFVENDTVLNQLEKKFQFMQSFPKEAQEVFVYNQSQNTKNINILKLLAKTFPHIMFKNLII